MLLSKVPPKGNPANDAIHPSEVFAKAKRNVLFWACVVVLLAMGSPTPGQNVEVSPVLRNFGFEPGILVLGSVGVLAFMLLGYRRAERHLVSEHAGFSLEHRLDEIIEVSDKLIDGLEKWSGGIDDAKYGYQSALGELETVDRQLREMSREVQASVPDFRAIAMRFGFSGIDQFTEKADHELIDRWNEMLAHIEGQLKQFRSDAQANLEQVTERLSNLHEMPPDALDRRVGEIEKEAADLSDNLRGFAKSIGMRERIWFWSHDRIPV